MIDSARLTTYAWRDLASGSYVAAIQDELGSTGASAEVHIDGASRYATATGAPLDLAASEPAAIVSFSPAAQALLSNGEIALDVLAAARADGTSNLSAPMLRISGDAQLSEGTAIKGSSSSPLPSIADIVNLAQHSLNDPTTAFYDIVNQQGGPASYIAYMGDPQVRQSFIEAFSSHTLTIQNAADVPGLDYQDNTVLTGTSETVHTSYNEKLIDSQWESGTASGVVTLPVIGGIYIAWPKAGTTAAPTISPGSS